MIVRHSIDPVEAPLPNPNLRGKQLVAPEDGTNHTAYDVFLQPGDSVQVTSGEKLRLFCIYCDDVEPTVDRAVTRSLSEIVGTDRDIDWGRGHSRRFLKKSDGFPISVHNTYVEAGTNSALCYKHHLESAYYVKGRATYTWEEGVQKAETRIDATNGTVYSMNEHDAHHAIAHEDAVALCVFHPVLVGNENHDFSGEYSGYKPSK
uniref:L-ectoine synthase n=1 Tax=Branchiostoma floridae TaxID=7739 RepID=C3XVW6_BRAFL|eukprot:XP_002611900.1 hypothetical protein BRAFLDRAFT_106802 [Branchiostoma floridae]